MSKKLNPVWPIKVFVFFAAIPYAFGQSAPHPNDISLDSLIRWVANNVYENADTAYQYAHIALNRAQKIGNNELIGDIHEHLALWHFSNTQSENRDSINYYD